MLIIGLTGGTGSGKSTVGQRLSERGFSVIDADVVGHEVIAPGGAAEAGVIAAFGEGILRDGHIDRDKLGQRVFGDPAALEQLNGLVHPAIISEIGRRCIELAEADALAVIIDAALLAESGRLEPWLGGLILVLCPEEERVRRLVEERGMSAADARARIASQTDPASKGALATWVIENNGTIEALYEQVDRIADAIEVQAG